MKILIAYASRHGAAALCAEQLKSLLHGFDVTVADLAREQPDPVGYDVVLAGGSVYFGKLLPACRNFLQANRSTLAEKRLGLFLCCGLAHESEYYMEKFFPRELRASAFQVSYFGGRLQKDGLSFWERLIVRSMRSSILESEIEDGEYTPTMPGLLPENVERMAGMARCAR